MEFQEKINLLYVDDEPINLELFQLTFQKFFNIKVAISGQEGLQILESDQSIEVVLSDMKMPLMNGIEFIKKAKEFSTNICFLILTGFDINIEIKDALKKGLITGYFRKPINKTEIINGIKNSVKK